MEEDNQQQVSKMSLIQLRSLISTILEERIAVLESVVEGQTVSVNDIDKKCANFLDYMPPGLDQEKDMAWYIKEVSKK